MPSIDSPLTFVATAPSTALVTRAPGRRAFALLGLATLASGFAPHDRYTWALEVLVLAVVYAGYMLVHTRWPALRPSARFSWLLFTYAFVMLIGAHATYGHALPGEWLRAILGLERNPWDRVGHLFQGAVPALYVHERLSQVGGSGVRRLAATLAAGLAVALFFEGAELVAAHFAADPAAFVQAKGDPFDSLCDVLFAGLGALVVAALGWRFGRSPATRSEAGGPPDAE